MIWREGVAAVVAVVLAILAGIAVIDLYFEARRWRPVGDRVRVWSQRYPLLSAGLLALLGAMLVHFFIHTGWGER